MPDKNVLTVSEVNARIKDLVAADELLSAV